MLTARRKEELSQVASRLLVSFPNAIVKYLVMDITDIDSIKKTVTEIESTMGPLTILVNNAGVMKFELMKNCHYTAWNQTIDVNCKGTMQCIAATLPLLLERKKGHIVTITSDAARQVFPGLGIYSASKMFLEGAMTALRLETVGSGVKVTCIQPGNVATDLVSNANASSGIDEEAMALYGTPSTCKVLTPRDIGAAVVYAVTQPDHVSVNQILVEPRDEPI